jgi:hypothetical protein
MWGFSHPHLRSSDRTLQHTEQQKDAKGRGAKKICTTFEGGDQLPCQRRARHNDDKFVPQCKLQVGSRLHVPSMYATALNESNRFKQVMMTSEAEEDAWAAMLSKLSGSK